MKRRRKTKISAEELYRLWNKGLSDHEIAKLMDFSQTGISRARQRLNLKPNYPSSLKGDDRTPEEIYADSKVRANKWKIENLAYVRKAFSIWQKANRVRRSAYQWLWKNGFV